MAVVHHVENNPMMYAVTIEPLNTIVFLSDPPEEGDWDLEENISLDVPMNFADWIEGTELPEALLCRSTTDERHYKVFRYSRDVELTRYRPTGRMFGGLLSRSTWRHFVKTLPMILTNLEIREEDFPGSGVEESQSSTKR
ncbi:hypothetical protein ACYOEI_21860 [Singulisphaera rosea]